LRRGYLSVGTRQGAPAFQVIDLIMIKVPDTTAKTMTNVRKRRPLT
jgi:hypothetical protein